MRAGPRPSHEAPALKPDVCCNSDLTCQGDPANQLLGMMLLTPSLALALFVSGQLGLLIKGSELDASFPEGSADGLVSAVEIARQAEHLESDFLGCVCLGQELLALAVDGLEELVRYGLGATLRLLRLTRRTLSHSSLQSVSM